MAEQTSNLETNTYSVFGCTTRKLWVRSEVSRNLTADEMTLRHASICKLGSFISSTYGFSEDVYGGYFPEGYKPDKPAINSEEREAAAYGSRQGSSTLV